MNKDFLDGALHTEVTGAGPAIWLLHSLLADAGSCRPLASRLAATHRVVLPDLPGFAGSAPAGPGWKRSRTGSPPPCARTGSARSCSATAMAA